MKKLLLLFFCAILNVSRFTVCAQSGKTGKLRWNISNDTLTIDGVGVMPNYKYKQGKFRIKSPWYSYLKKVTKIVICNGVTSIGNNAFYFVDDEAFTSPNLFGSQAGIGDNSQNHCGLTSVLIPNSVISIGSDAFRNCRNLTSIEIPNSITTIGSSAFSDCRSLISVNIPNSITTVESYVFDGCTNMISVSIPNSVTSISYSAFRGCHSLTAVVIPNSTITIGGHAFAYSHNLKSVTIPNSVVDIDNTAFENCDSLSEIINYATIPQTIRPYNTFSNIDKINCILRVPKSAVPVYRSADAWKEFKNIAAITNE